MALLSLKVVPYFLYEILIVARQNWTSRKRKLYQPVCIAVHCIASRAIYAFHIIHQCEIQIVHTGNIIQFYLICLFICSFGFFFICRRFIDKRSCSFAATIKKSEQRIGYVAESVACRQYQCWCDTDRWVQTVYSVQIQIHFPTKMLFEWTGRRCHYLIRYIFIQAVSTGAAAVNLVTSPNTTNLTNGPFVNHSNMQIGSSAIPIANKSNPKVSKCTAHRIGIDENARS